MKFQKFNGIVIKETNINDADKIVTLLTDKKGKISVFAKGVRRNRNHLSLCTQFLCYSKFIIFKSKDKYYLSSAELIESFYHIREDIEKVIYSSHIMELANDGIQENQYSNNMLRLVLNTLYLINKEKKNRLNLLIRIFELKFISLIGFTPNVGECSLCGNKDFEKIYFSFKNSGRICDKCYVFDNGSIVISKSFVNAVNYIVNSDIKLIFKITTSQSLLNELNTIVEQYIRMCMEKKYLKLSLLEDVVL